MKTVAERGMDRACGAGDAAEPEVAGHVAIADRLRRFLAGERVCLLGVGNRYRRDDGCGSLVAEQIGDRTGAVVIDCGAVPENYLEKVARLEPDTILVIDAVDFGGSPGELRLLGPDLISPSGLSTHALSLRMAADFLKARTSARLAILAIQPAELGPGEGLSDEVYRAVQSVEDMLVAVCGDTSEWARASRGVNL